MSALDFVPFGLSPEHALAAAAGLAAFAAVAAVWQALLARDPMAARARALTRHRLRLRAGLMAPGRNRSRPLLPVGLMRRLVEGFNLVRGRQGRANALRLAGAGWRGKDALVVYLFFKLSLPFVFGAGAAAVVYGLAPWPLPPLAKLAAALAAVIVGAYLPEVVVGRKAERRRHAVRKALPDALDLMVICAEAGLSLDAALERVAREMAPSAPALADEFALTAVELGFLPERAGALNNLMQRVDLAAVRGLVGTLAQTERYGTPLTQSLRTLAAEFRAERLLKAEEKAAKLPATLTVPLVLFILPALFIVLLGPAVISAIDGLGGLGR